MTQDSLPQSRASSPNKSADPTQAGRRQRRSQKSEKPQAKLQLPGEGEELFGFRLRHELGRGAFARVYLAEQADLASRPVVLKVSDLDGDEPQTLAQLQHTYIVPIYSVHENVARGLRAVCMPYFGGASLSQVLEHLWAKTKHPTRGAELVSALGAMPSPPTLAHPSARLAEGEVCQVPKPASLTFLNETTYVRAVACITAQLAEALQHAHQRRVIHRDVKPSNVLLCEDGQPMLLDFNVSQTCHNGRTTATLGGTVAYMAPEHLRALASTDETLASRVDHRADVYSLGMVLYEMLCGGRPFTNTGSYSPGMPVLIAMALERGGASPSPRQKRPDVPWSLESIVRKALHPVQGDRYQQAEHFAEDLRRFLDDRPLKYAPELSWNERVRKWLRRHPRVTSSATVATAAGVLLLGLGATLVGVREHLANTREELAVADAQERKREFDAGTVRALCLVNTTSKVADHLRQGVAACERALALYGVLEAEEWQRNPAWQRLSSETRLRLAEDVRELLLMLAWARVQTTPEDPAVLRGAIDLLARADGIEGLAPSRASWEARAHYLRRLGQEKEAEEAKKQGERLSPASARDHYLLATSYAREGKVGLAIGELDAALALNPRHYWSLVQRGICYQEQGNYVLAAGDFGLCIGILPDLQWGYFNRAYVFEKAGRKPEAIRDYTTALERDPEFVLAYLNRGMIYLDGKNYAQALADFQHAVKLGRDDASVHLGQGVALEGLGRSREADEAFQAVFPRAAKEPPQVRTRLAWVYGMTVAKRLPAKAEEAFDSILQREPNHPQALYGRALLLVEQKQEREAIKLFDRAIESEPTLFEAWRFRAILRARAGQLARASDEINWCLEREPKNGAAHYAAACVAALAAGRASDPAVAGQVGEQAVSFLARAFELGYGREQAATDADLASLRGTAAFRGLLARPGPKR